MSVLKLIKTRRSVRKFKKESVPQRVVKNILEAGRWAPSGLNNQPWRFMVLEKEKKDGLARYTKYASIIKSANKLILVFMDKKDSYNYEKDLMAIGASIQNMLLYIHSQGYGACWLGEILNQREEIQKYFRTPNSLELEAVIALGRPDECGGEKERKRVEGLVIK